MSEAAHGSAGQAPAFSVRAILALVAVGIVAFAGLAVLSAYAPELRTGNDGRAHALSRSAVGFAGVPILMKSLGQTVVISRTRPHTLEDAMVILTPDPGDQAKSLIPFASAARTLIILPKWMAAPDPLRRGFVRKAGLMRSDGREYTALLKGYSRTSRTMARTGVTRPTLRGAGGPFAEGTSLPLGRIDRLQTISGDGWAPALVDETGATVLAYSRKDPKVWLLADPDLLNNQGLRELATARAGVAVLDAASAGGAQILFDVTLAGFERSKGLGRVLLEPPWVAATLCAVAATLLMGFHALARFGQPRRRGRAIALGARALVDNSADLVRMARKEHELAASYAALIRALVARGAGGHTQQEGWLDDLAARRGVTAPAALSAEAETAKTRDDLLEIAKKLYDWRGEMMRERR